MKCIVIWCRVQVGNSVIVCAINHGTLVSKAWGREPASKVGIWLPYKINHRTFVVAPTEEVYKLKLFVKASIHVSNLEITFVMNIIPNWNGKTSKGLGKVFDQMYRSWEFS